MISVSGHSDQARTRRQEREKCCLVVPRMECAKRGRSGGWRNDQTAGREAGTTRVLRTFGVAATAVAATRPLGDGARADTEATDERRKPRYRETIM